MLLKSLVIIGATLGLVVGTIGTAIPWLFPGIFTHDKVVTSQMHTVIIPYFVALSITPSTHSLEGVLLILSNRGFGLRGCWYALVGFQWDGVLFSEDASQYAAEKAKAA